MPLCLHNNHQEEVTSPLQHSLLDEVPKRQIVPMPAFEFELTHDPNTMTLLSVAAMTRPKNVVNDFYLQHGVHIFKGDQSCSAT